MQNLKRIPLSELFIRSFLFTWSMELLDSNGYDPKKRSSIDFTSNQFFQPSLMEISIDKWNRTSISRLFPKSLDIFEEKTEFIWDRWWRGICEQNHLRIFGIGKIEKQAMFSSTVVGFEQEFSKEMLDTRRRGTFPIKKRNLDSWSEFSEKWK